MPDIQDWSKWKEERARFKKQDTKGLSKDVAALEAHIKVLKAVCPKDKAGVLNLKAWDVITRLTNDLNRFYTYLALCGT